MYLENDFFWCDDWSQSGLQPDDPPNSFSLRIFLAGVCRRRMGKPNPEVFEDVWKKHPRRTSSKNIYLVITCQHVSCVGACVVFCPVHFCNVPPQKGIFFLQKPMHAKSLLVCLLVTKPWWNGCQNETRLIEMYRWICENIFLSSNENIIWFSDDWLGVLCCSHLFGAVSHVKLL